MPNKTTESIFCEMQRPAKPLFADWLIQQVQTGRYEGLCYVTPNKIRIPWKHNSRKDCNDVDTQLFHDWAVVSGKIHEFPDNKARWKTNVRCNLNNITCFKMIEDNSKSTSPHKIYEIINTKENTLTQDPSEDLDCDLYTAAPQEHVVNNSMVVEYGSHLTGYQNPDWPPSIIELEVSIYYRNKQMLKTKVNQTCLQLHYLHEAPETTTLNYSLRFPTTEGLLDKKQIRYTENILESIQRGIVLEVCQSGIYATRQDNCRVFASTDNPSMVPAQPRILPQNKTVELFSFEKFVAELEQYRENNASSPNYTITMCFGEKFPDGKPLEKKLISVQVVPLILKHYYEMAQKEGASSLNSTNVSLQFSHLSLFDFIASKLSPPPTEFHQ
ncbi:interferon regulatory factor 7 isoform X1 [Nerophis lumbriciformis]|uniref:interferon regulatory factor 7 isoform X1 n=1 Tax=Nerophis lumbriciformis TaxID=546530 RepID=UPI002ADF6967|nr:interferon regulatory factor 3-like isoform X1 [Nerophis lumbriciformis]